MAVSLVDLLHRVKPEWLQLVVSLMVFSF
jgi:hypothetical protein